jgi:hypothetical protein
MIKYYLKVKQNSIAMGHENSRKHSTLLQIQTPGIFSKNITTRKLANREYLSMVLNS